MLQTPAIMGARPPTWIEAPVTMRRDLFVTLGADQQQADRSIAPPISS
jgi:hypothetical protein